MAITIKFKGTREEKIRSAKRLAEFLSKNFPADSYTLSRSLLISSVPQSEKYGNLELLLQEIEQNGLNTVLLRLYQHSVRTLNQIGEDENISKERFFVEAYSNYENLIYNITCKIPKDFELCEELGSLKTRGFGNVQIDENLEEKLVGVTQEPLRSYVERERVGIQPDMEMAMDDLYRSKSYSAILHQVVCEYLRKAGNSNLTRVFADVTNSLAGMREEFPVLKKYREM